MDLAALFLTFGAIFLVELPDKTFLATLVLATRYRPILVWLGVGAAFTAQTGVAVVLGQAVSFLPDVVVQVAAAVLFLIGAVLLFREARAHQKGAEDDEGEEFAAKAAPAKTQPIKQALTKSALVNLIVEQNGVTRAVAQGVLGTIEGAMAGSIHPKGVGEFTFPGLLKISLRKVPARKAGTLIRNPSTGQMVPGAAKPASVRVQIRPLAKLKAATV